jgi:probable H4MPT-linked C1 transfer pathway protein
MGSTTTDIIPVLEGQIAAEGKTDSERFRNGELVYVGADRTPVCSVVNWLKHDGKDFPAAAELFATVGDAMLLCGHVDEDASRCDTADGRPRTIRHAAQRMCRMACEDVDTVGMETATGFAQHVLSMVNYHITDSIVCLEHTRGFKNIIVTGSGVGFIKPKLESMYPEVGITSLGDHVDGEVNTVAPAWAVAVLADERLPR